MSSEKEKRNEIFFNETLAYDEIDRLLEPKVLTNFKRCKEWNKTENLDEIKIVENGVLDENLIIKGNNLLVLHTLRKKFLGKVKLIYIDPPYNTGGTSETFTYSNNFKHSSWLTFMKDRLNVAKEILCEDGFICIAIDHYELFYLGGLTDEIFGRENRIGVISVIHKPGGRNQEKFSATSNEFMLVYSKNKIISNFNRCAIHDEEKKRFDKKDAKGNYMLINFLRDNIDDLREKKPNMWYPIYVSPNLKEVSLTRKEGFIEVLPISNSGREMSWKTTKETFWNDYEKGNIVVEKKDEKLIIFRKYRENQVIKTHWDHKKYNSTTYGTKLLKKIIGRKGVSYPKSLYLVQDVLKLMTNKNDIILDFFAGSGTTGHAVLEQNKEDGGNRKFILVEQLNEHIKICKERIQKVVKRDNIDDDFIYCELMKYNEEAIDKIQEASNTETLLKIWEEMCNTYFLNYEVKIKEYNDNLDKFRTFTLQQQKEILIEMLNKNQLYVNYSEIKDKQFNVSEKDKKLNRRFQDFG